MSDLESLGVTLVDQDQLETSITKRANEALIAKDSELDQKRLEKATTALSSTVARIQKLRDRLTNPHTKLSQRKQLEDDIKWFDINELQPRKRDVEEITARLRENQAQLKQSRSKDSGKPKSDRLPGETEKEFLIRTGKITAFGSLSSFVHGGEEQTSRQHLRMPGFEKRDERRDDNDQKTYIKVKQEDDQPEDDQPEDDQPEDFKPEIPNKDIESNIPNKDIESDIPNKDIESNIPNKDIELDIPNDLPNENIEDLSDQPKSPDSMDYIPDAQDSASDDSDVPDAPDVSDVSDSASFNNDDSLVTPSDLKKPAASVDDGDELHYQQRLTEWVLQRSEARGFSEPNVPEWNQPHPTVADAVLNKEYRLPGDIYPALFDYQKTCVQWLWELYTQKTGGIIGDEMGLGKTVQVIAFLAGLHYSGILTKPVLVVVPATVLNQWVNEFHRWWPPMRCVILHSIGAGMGKGAVDESKLEQYLETLDGDEERRPFTGTSQARAHAHVMVDRVMRSGHVMVTTYVGLKMYAEEILAQTWGYVVLDEGHKIRNPDLDIALTCKRIKTPHRIILLGTPIQNNLVELWSLFDFVFPGRLGTLPVFQQEFSVPINMGGYANALNVQVQTGYKCAVVLRDLVQPYLLRRLKADVAQDLPKKLEMVLFVKLTPLQRDLYERFLNSEDLHAILKGKRNMLQGVDTLRKICNHPDLLTREYTRYKAGYGDVAKSGKMQVLQSLLALWRSQGHRTLLFCQTKQMLDILEKFVSGSEYRYLRMDGLTPIVRRQVLVDTFNGDESVDVFLLTTKVGGLGVNLTGADRVIIYDPDWNPSTDIQARERAWRLGQKKDITIYRLMTAGSIEEKIYHRQIFKTFLTNKILKDPKQRRFFKVNDLHDIFTLGDDLEKGTETGEMFEGAEKQYAGDKTRKPTRLLPRHKNDDDFYEVAKMTGVSKVDEYEGGEDKDKGEKEGPSEKSLMEGIFAQTGVHSTLEHDHLIEHGTQEVSLVEREASKVARAAAEALKQSRKLARKNEIGTPTWTGRFGHAGKFGPKKAGVRGRAAVSSLAILSGLKEKKDVRASAFVKPEGKEELLKKLVGFMEKKVAASSNEVLRAMGMRGAKEPQMVLLRSMLREACEWDGKLKVWTLKSEFREQKEGKGKSDNEER